MNAFSQLMPAIEALGEFPTFGVFVALAAAGTLSMALLQLVKELTPLRTWYQRVWVKDWVASRIDVSRNVLPASLGKSIPSNADALNQLVELATGGDEHALFELTAEQMVAQMNAAAGAALDYPKKYAKLVMVLSAGADAQDVAAVVGGPARTTAKDPGADYLDARNRVGNRIQRNLDGLQISLSSRWKLWMQIFALVLTVVLILLGIWYANVLNPSTFVAGIFAGIVGGYIAPVTRDLVAALQSLRKA